MKHEGKLRWFLLRNYQLQWFEKEQNLENTRTPLYSVPLVGCSAPAPSDAKEKNLILLYTLTEVCCAPLKLLGRVLHVLHRIGDRLGKLAISPQ